jgi:hypothetical protein
MALRMVGLHGGRARARTTGVLHAIASAAVAMGMATPAVAAAQSTSSLDVLTRAANGSPDGWASWYAVAPSLRWDHAHATLDASGIVGASLDGQSRTRWSREGTLSATAFTPSWLGFSASLSAGASREMLAPARAVGAVTGGARVSYRRGATGVWIGRDAVRDDQRTPYAPVPQLVYGAWRQVGSTVFTFSLGRNAARFGVTTPDTIVRVDTLSQTSSTTRYEQRAWSDAEAGARWARGPLALAATVGWRVGSAIDHPEQWGTLDATYALSPRLALVGGVGSRPARLAYAVPSARYASFGLRVAPPTRLRPRVAAPIRPVAARFDVRPSRGGMYTVRLRVPGARVVELSGDFTSWRPVTLRNTEGDLWEATLPIAPGTHLVNIRVNGDAWTAPPGTSETEDEFGGKVGVVHVQ